MKKAGLIVASLVLAGAAAMAQTPVYSVNAVGYVKTTVAPNKYTLLGSPFAKVGSGSAPIVISDLMGTNNALGDGAVVYFYNGSGYVGETFYQDYGWDPGTNDATRADAFWFTSPTNVSVVFAGEVPGSSYAATTSVAIAHGYQLVSYPYPVSIAASNTALGLVANDLDVVYKWNGTAYVGYTYYLGYGWDPQDLTFNPSEGFWYYRDQPGSVTWNEPMPYSGF